MSDERLSWDSVLGSELYSQQTDPDTTFAELEQSMAALERPAPSTSGYTTSHMPGFDDAPVEQPYIPAPVAPEEQPYIPTPEKKRKKHRGAKVAGFFAVSAILFFVAPEIVDNAPPQTASTSTVKENNPNDQGAQDKSASAKHKAPSLVTQTHTPGTGPDPLPESGGPGLLVGSFNTLGEVHFGRHGSFHHARMRMKLAAQAIKKGGYDIVGFQELEDNHKQRSYLGHFLGK